jgi:hypothetical protein
MLSHLSKTKLLQTIRKKRNPSSKKSFFIVRDSSPAGGYGTYIALDKSTGIKISHSGFSTKKKLLKSKEWKRTKKEFNNLKKAAKLLGNSVPKAKLLFPIFVEYKDTRYDVNTQTYISFTKKEWRPAFAMQHISGSTLSHIDLNYQDKMAIFKQANSLLDEANIFHSDLHYQNIMLKPTANKKHKFFIIDWDSQFVSWSKR